MPPPTSPPTHDAPASRDTPASRDPAPSVAPERSAARPLGRRERRKREVRERIYSVARELFAKQGFDATTVDEIARVADVAPATFFNHFQSKQALLGLMTGEVFETLHVMTSEHLEGEGSASEKLRAFIRSAAEGISASRGIARDVLLEFMRGDATAKGPHPYLERLFEPFVALIEEGQRAGEMRNDHDAAFLAQMAVGMMNSAVTNWLTNPDFPVEKGLVDAAEFALLALRADPAEASSERNAT